MFEMFKRNVMDSVRETQGNLSGRCVTGGGIRAT